MIGTDEGRDRQREIQRRNINNVIDRGKYIRRQGRYTQGIPKWRNTYEDRQRESKRQNRYTVLYTKMR